jgi:hypothetical protein
MSMVDNSGDAALGKRMAGPAVSRTGWMERSRKKLPARSISRKSP